MSKEKEIVKKYEKGDLTIVWKPGLCIHSAICAKGLHHVFRPKERPWIVPEGADADAIKAQIDECPSGALSYIDANADVVQPNMEKLSVMVKAGGPIVVAGALEVKMGNGETIVREGNTAFCRCGALANKPFCDGAHKEIEFE